MFLIKLHESFYLFKEKCENNQSNLLVKLVLKFNKYNEGDRFSLYLNQDLLDEIKVLPNKSITYNLEYFKKIYSMDCILSLKNTSDDYIYLQSYKGGIIMSDPLQILNVTMVNPKSFDVILNQNYLDDDIFEVNSLTDIGTEINFTVSRNTNDPSLDKRTIVLDSGSELISGHSYEVSVTRDNEIATYQFDYVSFPATIDCNIETFGDRILKISFPYPVRNLDKIHSDAEKIMENFYALYFRRDTNISNIDTPEWVGYFDLANTFTARISADSRSIELQRNLKGFPIGTHDLIVNYSKHQEDSLDPNVILTDYNNPYRDIPIMEKSFTVAKSDLPARAIDLLVVSRTEVIVVYDKAVLLRDLADMNVLSSNGIPINATAVERYECCYNRLRYSLDPSTPLQIGTNVPITIGSIVDANGYDTEAATFYRNVEGIKPEFLSVTQKEDISTPNTTELELTFSQEMNMSSSNANSATNINNYIVRDGSNVQKNIISITSIDAYKALMVTEKLPTGDNFVTAKDINNLLEESIDETTLRVAIEDYTAPAIVEIIATTPTEANMTNETNALIIKFDEAMATTGKNSYISYLNYRFDYSNGGTEAKYELPSSTMVTPLNGNTWVRFELPINPSAPYPGFAIADYTIWTGFAKVKDVRLVQNAYGNYYPLCKPGAIDRLIDKLSIADGNLHVLSDTTLRFIYTGDNSFYSSVNKLDFGITLDSSLVTPLSVSIVEENVLEFIFAPNTFTSSSYDITISTRAQAEIATKDIFNKAILGATTNPGPAQNKVKSVLNGISIANIGRVLRSDTTATLALKFNQEILSTSKDDFRVILDDTTLCDILTATVLTDHNDTVELVCKIPATTDFVNATFKVSVARSEALLQTIDLNHNTIPVFANMPAQELLVNSFIWNANAANEFGSSTFDVVFDKAIDFESLDAGFETIDTVTIAATTLSSDASSTVISFGSEFGSIMIVTTAQLIATTDTITSAQAVKVNDNTLRLRLNDSRTDTLDNAVFGIYVPEDYVIIDSTDSVYVNASYQPTGIPQSGAIV